MTVPSRFLAFAGLALLLSAAFLGSTVGAVESHGIGGVPANPRPNNPRTNSIFVYEIKPGASVKDAIKVVNNTDKKKTIKIYPVDSQHSSDGAFACAQAADKQTAAGTWIKLAKASVTLEPMSNEIVPFTLQLPETIDVGEHNGCIAIQDDRPPKEIGTNGIALSFRSAVRVAVTVPGDIHANVNFLRIDSALTKDMLRLSPVLKNDGNISVDTTLSVGLKNIFGMDAASASGKFSLLKAEEGRVNFEVRSPFWGGWYNKTGTVEYVPLREDTADQGERKVASAPSEWIFVSPHPLAAFIEVAVLFGIVGAAAAYFWHRQQNHLLAQRTIEHTVKPKDTLQSLADHAGISWQRLARLNSLKAPYTLTPGQTIRLPEPPESKKKNAKSV